MTNHFIYDHVPTPFGRGEVDGELHEVTALVAMQAHPLRCERGFRVRGAAPPLGVRSHSERRHDPPHRCRRPSASGYEHAED
jgi:hypothetical protein